MISKICKALCIILFLLSFITCRHAEKQSAPAVKDTSEKKIAVTVNEKPAPPLSITYHAIDLDSIRITKLDSEFTKDQLQVLLAINRIDFEHIWKTKTLVVPDTFLPDLKSYSPFPDSMPLIKDVRKILFFSYPAQTFAAYENGLLIRWGPVSMGKRSTPTPTGLLHTNWKSPQTTSTVNEEWIMNWYFNLDNKMGVSMHQYDLPGYPASHACVRLSADDAYRLYHWAEQWILADDTKVAAYGTPVIIFGNYPFRKRKPWLALPENNKATQINKEELSKEVETFLPLIIGQQAERDSVMAHKKLSLPNIL